MRERPHAHSACVTLIQAPSHFGLVELLKNRGVQAGHKALHTCMSWYAYAAMFGSSDGSN